MPQPAASGGSSSSSAPPAPVVKQEPPPSPRDDDKVKREVKDELDDEDADRPGRPRAARAPRPQPRVRDVAVGEALEDWTNFDVTASMRGLRDGDMATKRRTLRKLHLRWWHANRSQMEKILGAAGVPVDVLGMIPSIIETCRECRAWASNRPDSTPSVELSVVQDEQVEADILFYKRLLVWHMVDRADRFHNGEEIENKTPPVLMRAIHSVWIKIFGPPKYLIIDGEGGVIAADTAEDLKRAGDTVRT